MTTRDMVNKVIGEVPRMDHPKAADIVKEAWQEIYGEKLWSWKVKNGVWNVPPAVATGGLTTTRGSASITFNAEAVTAINLTSTLVPVIGRQLRISTTGAIYTITAYNNSTGVATLNRVYATTSLTANTDWSVVKMYHTAPGGADFMSFRTIIDPDQGYRLKHGYTQREIDSSDPQRQSEGQAYRVGYHDRDDPTLPGVARFEAWPVPTEEVTLLISYVAKGETDFNDVALIGTSGALNLAFEFPMELPNRLITEKCLEMAHKWAESRKGEFEELRGINWRFLWQENHQMYGKMLVEAKKNDAGLGLTEYLPPKGANAMAPIDASFAQSHDVDWI